MQKLSAHEGVKYFRMTFLFFGIASLLKLLARHLAISFFFYPGLLDVSAWALALGVLGITYTHTMAAFFLLYSITCRSQRTERKLKPWMLHVLAVVISFVILLTKASALYILFQVFVIAYSIGIIHTKTKSGKKSQMLVIYELLLVFWMLNLLDTTLAIASFWQAVVYGLSFTIFLIILYKVWKNLRVVKQ
ncbi:MAG: hypothetical protein GOV00_00790 [Candidatus Altiarchaeota archaeon]|nr:hypothetical protein [Candidatus Altiarchaeota archaeon]